jgi:catalase
MKNYEIPGYKSNDGHKYAFYFNSKDNLAWAIRLSPTTEGSEITSGREGPELVAKSEDDARQKLIEAIESGTYLS